MNDSWSCGNLESCRTTETVTSVNSNQNAEKLSSNYPNKANSDDEIVILDDNDAEKPEVETSVKPHDISPGQSLPPHDEFPEFEASFTSLPRSPMEHINHDVSFSPSAKIDDDCFTVDECGANNGKKTERSSRPVHNISPTQSS